MNSFTRVLAFQIQLEFGSVGFWGERKTGVPEEKPLGARERTNNKLNPHMASRPGFEPGPHWLEASALATAPPLLPEVSCKWSSLCYLRLQKPCAIWNPAHLLALIGNHDDCQKVYCRDCPLAITSVNGLLKRISAVGIDGADFNLAIMMWPQPMYYTVEAEWIFFHRFLFLPVPGHLFPALTLSKACIRRVVWEFRI